MSGRQFTLAGVPIDRGRWARPLQPWPADTERWARFCAEIKGRIDTVRRLTEPNTLHALVSAPLPDLLDELALDETDWLFRADGPSAPAWVARVRADLGVDVRADEEGVA